MIVNNPLLLLLLLIVFEGAASALLSSDEGLLPGYPGVLSQDYIQIRVEEEVRARLFDWARAAAAAAAAAAAESSNSNATTDSFFAAAAAKNTTHASFRRNHRRAGTTFSILGGDDDEPEEEEPEEEQGRVDTLPPSSTTTNTERAHEADVDNDLLGLNDILSTLAFDIPETSIQQGFLGSQLTVTINGTCGNITLETLGLNYTYNDVSLTYLIDVTRVDLDCDLFVVWDAGAYNLGETSEILFPVIDSDFVLEIQLNGKPPETSNFTGCQAEIHLGNVSSPSPAGFTSNLVNELDFWFISLVGSEAAFISDLLCDQFTGFTSIVDNLLTNLTSDFLAPFLEEDPSPVDPLALEQRFTTTMVTNNNTTTNNNSELVDFTNSTLGLVLNSILTNIRGVVGAYQINTLLELNLLDENGLFTFNLTDGNATNISNAALFSEGEGEVQVDVERVDATDVEGPLEDDWSFRRWLQEQADDLATEIINSNVTNTSSPAFTLNSLELLSIQVEGLNTFTEDLQLMEIIGKHTLQSKFELGNITVRALLAFDVSFNNVNITEDSVEIFVPIHGLALRMSYLVGLNQSVIDGLSLGALLNADDLLSCLTPALVTVAFSELNVTVGQLGVPLVTGLISPGVDTLIGTVLESVVLAYQELIVRAIPNTAQNATDLINGFIDGFLTDFISSNNATACALAAAEDGSSNNTLTTPEEGFAVFSFERR